MTAAATDAAALLSTLLPGDGDFPDAGTLDLPLAALDRFGPPLAAVLARLPADFAALPQDLRTAAAARAEADDPDAFAAMVTGAYSLYYTHPAVAAVLARLTGHSGAPPQPLGHPLDPFDPALVAVPAARAPLWRPIPGEAR
jgi:hypothetical protein